MSPPSNLLELVLNEESSHAYGDDTNYTLQDETYGGSALRQSITEKSQQLFTGNGIGYKAFILAYQNQGLNNSTTGKTNTNGAIQTASPTDGILGSLANGLLALGLGEDDPAVQALSQINVLNGIKAYVWIPTLDRKVPEVYKTSDNNSAIGIRDLQSFPVCKIEDERLISSLPPHGSLVLVDYENRETKSGLTLKYPICTDANFARIIMGELRQETSPAEPQTTRDVLVENKLSVPTGDPIGWVHTPRITPDEIVQLAADYDSDTPNRVGNKAGHLAGQDNAKPLDQLHPDFQVYIKAFLRKAWDDNGATIYINSTYRTHVEQQDLIDKWIANAHLPPKDRGAEPAPPGKSYHNFAMAIDFNPAWEQGNYPSGAGLSDARPFLAFSDDNSLWLASNLPAIGSSVGLRWGGTFDNRDPIHFDFGGIVSARTKDQLVAMAQEQDVPLNRVDLSAVV